MASVLVANATGQNLTLPPDGTQVGWMGDSISTSAFTNAPAQYASASRVVVSWAVSGAGFVGGATQILPQYSANFTNQTRIVIEGGVNDFINNITSAQVQSVLFPFVQARLNEGKQVVLNTCMPWGNYVAWTAPRQTQTDAYNSALRAFAVSLMALRLPVFLLDTYAMAGGSNPQTIAAQYDSGDGLHENSLFGGVWASALAAILP